MSYETELTRINHFTCYKAPYSIMVGTVEAVQINPKESTYTHLLYTYHVPGPILDVRKHNSKQVSLGSFLNGQNQFRTEEPKSGY